MLLALAWKNVWRNKTRSAIIISAIALGLLGGLLACGVSFGMGGQMIEAAIKTRISDLQIHHKNFREDRNIGDTIAGAAALAAGIDHMDGVAATSLRMIVTAMASTPVTAAGVNLTGIVPDRERRVTDVADHIVRGRYLKVSDHNGAVIGEALAKELDCKTGSKVVCTFQDDSGSLTGGAFRVMGIFRTVSSDFDKTALFVNAADLQRLAGGNKTWHEIAVLLRTGASLDSVLARLRPLASGLRLDTWKELAPDLAYVSDILTTTLYFFMVIILAALAFGIVNTMLMAVLERRREFGMLMAVGMARKTVFGMIVLETVLLSLTGAAAGMALTVAAIAILGGTGINLSIISSGLGRFGIPEVLRPLLPPSMYPIIAALVVVTAIIAALYPAVKALRLRPSEALRTL